MIRGRNIQVRVDAALVAALKKLAKRNRRSITGEVNAILFAQLIKGKS